MTNYKYRIRVDLTADAGGGIDESKHKLSVEGHCGEGVRNCSEILAIRFAEIINAIEASGVFVPGGDPEQAFVDTISVTHE